MYILILIGITLILWAVFKSAKYIAANKWVKTEGVLTDISEGKFKELNLYSYPSVYLYPIAKYEFSVKGKTYSNSLVTFEIKNICKPFDNNEKLWGGWKKGANIDVYYNPLNPSESVLIPFMCPHRRSHYLAIITAGVILTVIGFLLMKIGA